MQNEIYRKYTSITLMAIMVAGGLTFAIPGVDPVFAEVSTSNPHLYVSAEGQDPDNIFAEGNIIEVIIRDDTIGDTDEGEAEPEVTVNGADLRMLQTANGYWTAYFAEVDALAGIDSLPYGEYCTETQASTVTGLQLSDGNGIYLPPGSNCANDSTTADGHPLIREPRDLTNYDGNSLGQLGLSNANLWPFIQVFDFTSLSDVEIVYNRGGTQESVTLTFDDPSESHTLDRQKYPQGAHVHIALMDYALNIDPTDEDTWVFDTQNGAAYYNLFDEDGNVLTAMNPVSVGSEAGIDETVSINRGAQGNNVIECQVTKDFGIQEEDDASKDYLMVNDYGACVPNTLGGNAADLFNDDSFAIGFVEDGSNNNVFINWAEDQRSNIVVLDDALRGNSFEVDYSSPDAKSGVVGHFFAELSLDVSDGVWNSGERIPIVLTDMDANVNPLAEDDLTVANPNSLLVPSIRIGSPVTLASATGDVEWVDLAEDDNTAPTITLNGGDVTLVQGTTYTEQGAVCDDDRDADKDATASGNVDVDTAGTYTVTYSCMDNAGNSATSVTRTVTVVEADNTAPTVTLNGNAAATAVQGTTYNDPGAVCSDNVDADKTATPSGTVDTATLGPQTITYTCTDSSGNTSTATRTVTVVEADEEAPTITLNGNAADTVVQGGTYTDPGAICIDNVDAQKAATPSGTVDTATLGPQTITYTCTDSSGNEATPVTRTVTVEEADTEAPTVTLNGDATIRIVQGGTYTEPGAVCDDAVDGQSAATPSGNVNTNAVGTYTVTYTCTDSSNNSATADRTIHVGLPVVLANIVRDADGWTDGVYELTVTGTVSSDERDVELTTDDIEDFIPISVPVANDGSINGTVALTNIGASGDITFQLVSAQGAESNEFTVNIPPILQLFSIQAAPQWVIADPTNLQVPNPQLELRLSGSHGVGNAPYSVSLVTVDDPLTAVIPGVVFTNDATTRNMSDTSISDRTQFMLAVVVGDEVIAQSGVRAATIPTLLSASIERAAAWGEGTLTLTITGKNNTLVVDNDADLIYKIDPDAAAYTVVGVNPFVANTTGVFGTATLDTDDFATAGETIDFQLAVPDENGITSPKVSVDVPPILTLDPITIAGTWSGGATPTLTLRVSGSEGVSGTSVDLFVNGADSGLDVTSNADGSIATTASFADVSVSGDATFQLRSGDARSENQTVNIPPVLTLRSVAPSGTWENGEIDLRIEGNTLLTEGTVNLISPDVTGLTIAVPITGDDSIASNGAISGTVTLSNIAVSGATNFQLTSVVGANTATTENRTANIPSVLTLTSVVPGSWTGTSPSETIELVVTGASGLPTTATVTLQLVTGNASLTQPTDTLPVANDGSIFGSVTFGNSDLAGDNVSFNLTSTVAPNAATSNARPATLPALPSTSSVDMIPTPISSQNSGFPPITRAVIGDISEIPAIHNVQFTTDQTMDRTVYTWSDDDKTVEAFSDRLRLAEPSDRYAIEGKSKIIVYGWEPPTFADGVTTLFNWNFGGINYDGIAPDAVITDIRLANAAHNQSVSLGDGASGLVDITSMEDDIKALGDTVDLIIFIGDTNLGHVCGDLMLVADFFTFGQNDDDGRVNNAIYRIEVEEASSNSADYEGTIEYTMLNQLNIDDPSTYTDLRPISDQISIIVHEDFTDEDSVRVNYLDLGADGVSTQIAIQQAAPTHSAVVSFDSESYKIADTVTITLEDADLNVDNDVIDIYTFSNVHTDTIGDDGAFILDVTFDDELWTSGECEGADGFSSTGFTLQETTATSGVFTGDFQIPEVYCQSSTTTMVSVTGVDIEVNYQDFRDASGEEIEVGAGAAVRANTGTVSLDRTVYPVPFEAGVFEHTTGTLGQHDLTVHVTIDDPDFDISAAGEDVITNATEYLTVQVIRGSASYTIDLESAQILETAPDSGAFELDLPLAYSDGPDGAILQGDILQVEYRDPTDASGEENTVTDSATFDLRNGVLQSDKSVYIIGSDMILTLIEPDLDLENDGAESYTLDLIEWDSDAATLGMNNAVFDPEPSELRETGDSTGIFQVIAEIPAEIDGDRLERGEEIELEYVDWGPSGADYVGDESEDVGLTVYTSNFGATIELDQKVYTWTDKVYITIVAPDHNFDSALVDEIGDSNLDPIQVSTRSADIDNYKLVETGPDTGIFTGEVILIGFDHNADGDTETGTDAGYDNPQRDTSPDGSGPTNGYLQTDDDDGITVSFEYSEDETVVGSALIRWNIGEVQWLESSYPASGTGVVRVIDPDMNWNPEAVNNFVVDVWSDADNGGIDLTVTETNEATGIFEGTVFFTITDESSGHRLRVAEGNTVTAEYEDNTLPDPYTTADELDITATTLIGTIVPPLERAPATNLRIVDAFGNSLDTVSADQQVQIVADLANGQDRSQAFAYLVQVQDANGVTVALSWISGTLEAGQSLSPSTSWIPSGAGTYTATAFVWESVDNPTALSPPVTTDITVS